MGGVLLMKKIFQRLFAVMVVFALTITAMPMAEVRAEDMQEILVECTWLDETGKPNYTTTSVEVPVNVTYGELKEILEEPLSTENFTFTGWDAYYEDTEIVANGRAVFEATYDKYPVRFVKVYVDGNNNVITQKFTNYYQAGTTFEEIFQECTSTPDDFGTQYNFTKWNTSIYPAEEVGMNKTYCEIFADYANHNIIRLCYDYVKDMGDYGVPVDVDMYLFVNKEIALIGKEETNFQTYFEQNYAPSDHYEELGFTGWEWWNGANWDNDDDNDWALYVPNYSKAQIVLETDTESRVYAGEPGQSIQLPTEIDGTSVVWECDEDGLTYEGEYIVPQDVDGSYEIALRAINKEQQSNEKVEVTVYKEEYKESGRWSVSSETIKVSANATEEDIIALLSPGKDVAGLKFEGWTFIGFADGDVPLVQAVYDKNIVTQQWSYLDEEGEIANESETFIFDNNATYRDALKAIEEPEDVLGCTFVKWQLMDCDNSLDDKIEGSDLTWEAEYDKYPVSIEKIYIDNTGEVKVEESVKIYDAGTTMDSIYKENATVPADALNGTVHWFENEYEYEYEGTVALYNNWISYLAKYEDKVIVGYSYDYIEDADGYGKRIFDCMYVALDNAICASEEKLQEYYLNTIVPELNINHFSKIKFAEWYINDFYDSTGDGYFNYIHPQAVYDTSEVIILEGWVRNEEYDYIWTVETGQSITLPYNVEGYYLDWYDQNDVLIKNDVYTVPKDAVKGDWYYISAQKSGKIPTKNDATSSFIDESGVLPLGVSISSERIESGTVFENTKKLVDEKIKNIIDMAIFEINLYDKDGIALEQLDGKIKISVQLPFDIAEDEMVMVVRVERDKLVECEVVSAENNFCVFLTDHFSTYVFVKQKVAPKTGDDTNVLPYITLLVFGAGVYMVGSKKQNFVL